MNPFQRALAKEISEQYWWRGTPGMLVVYRDLTFRLRDPVTQYAKHIIQLPKSWGPVIMSAHEIMPDITDEKTITGVTILVHAESLRLREHWLQHRKILWESRMVPYFNAEGFDKSYKEWRIFPGLWYRERASVLLALSKMK